MFKAKIVSLAICLSVVGLFGVATATEVDPRGALYYEPAPLKEVELYCDEDDNITPAKNDFAILGYSMMSSEAGERHVLLTLKNNSTGQRLFNQDQLVAILGDCTRKKPLRVEKKFGGGERVTLQINFGYSRFPILKLMN
ncbi:MAG TPA: hypothetical protein VIC26_10875 [Marinagarivorans sp.]